MPCQVNWNGYDAGYGGDDAFLDSSSHDGQHIFQLDVTCDSCELTCPGAEPGGTGDGTGTGAEPGGGRRALQAGGPAGCVFLHCTGLCIFFLSSGLIDVLGAQCAPSPNNLCSPPPPADRCECQIGRGASDCGDVALHAPCRRPLPFKRSGHSNTSSGHRMPAMGPWAWVAWGSYVITRQPEQRGGTLAGAATATIWHRRYSVAPQVPSTEAQHTERHPPPALTPATVFAGDVVVHAHRLPQYHLLTAAAAGAGHSATFLLRGPRSVHSSNARISTHQQCVWLASMCSSCPRLSNQMCSTVCTAVVHVHGRCA